MSGKLKSDAYLFGPFIGELSWEFFRFAAHSIYLKKLRSNILTIVLTRPERFDFYGKYADILVPLRLKLAPYHIEECFRIRNYPEENYKIIANSFYDKYKQKFDIVEHFYPDIGWRYNVKWQYSNNMMSYDFRPREGNKFIVDSLTKDLKNIIYFDGVEKRSVSNYHCIDRTTFKFQVEKLLNSNSSYYGCIIELLRKCDFVVGNLNNDISKLALLLKIPLIDLNISTSDQIRLLNPFKTLVIPTENIEEGIHFYENHI